jgi:uncharacterized membrane protein YphA (DoxX/SURF4 family)
MAGERKAGGKGIMKAHGLPLFETIVRIAIAAVFLWSGSAKLVHPGVFAERLEGFQLLPWPWLVTLVTVTLPVLEIMLAILLWIGPWRRAALLLCAAMGLLFCGVLLSAQLRGLTADCGCFGAGEITPLTLPLAIARATLLTAAAAAAYAILAKSMEPPVTHFQQTPTP